MKKILIIIIFIIGAFLVALGIYSLVDANSKKEATSKYLVELSFADLKEKMANKETFFIYFKQDNCNHCAMFTPILTKVLDENKVTGYYLNFSYLDLDTKKELKQIISIEGTPTTVFITEGVEETTYNRLGNVSSDNIISRLKSLGYIKE